MQLHALLPDDSHRRLLAAVAHRHKVIRLNAAADLVRAATSGEVAACVIDPIHRRQDTIEALIARIEAGDFPVVLYTTLDVNNVRAICDMQARSGADVLLREHDEQPEYLRRAIDRMGVPSAAPLALQELAPTFRQIPTQLGAPCVSLFAGLSIPGTVAEFFARSGVRERTGNNWMNRAGLRGAECVLGCARLMLTWDEVRDPASNLADVAARAGIGTERALNNAYRAYSGLPTRRAGRELTTREFALRAATATRS